MVTLRHYQQGDFEALTHYCLPNEQAIYTSMPVDALRECEKDSQQCPIVICLSDSIIGFFVLHFGDSANRYTANKQAVIFKSFSIDQRYQGKQLAVDSLHLLPSFAKNLFPQSNEIVLTVHHTNLPAIHLYKKCGFLDKGNRYMGEHGEELILNSSLAIPYG
ncbi:GNAT family N-acetyltransferase [Brevibacillus sp. SYSU BS000544]|uniref:GNAT family N-acetyltransferase n=1 Tax=Brevibacillus sp. SYSU BS000544 TaxID=3416443 RepID=UPI003CE48C94